MNNKNLGKIATGMAVGMLVGGAVSAVTKGMGTKRKFKKKADKVIKAMGKTADNFLNMIK